MSRLFRAPLLALAMACLTLGTASAQTPPPAFSGAVYHGTPDRPVANVRVEFVGQNGEVYSGVSGPDGRYEVPAPPDLSGGYRLRWSGPNVIEGGLEEPVVGAPRQLAPIFVELAIFPVQPPFLGRDTLSVQQLQPTFVWRSIPGTSRYRLTITAAGLTVAEDELPVTTDQADFSLRLNTPLGPGQVYSWFVQGLGPPVTLDSGGPQTERRGAFNSAFRFRTATRLERELPGGGWMALHCFAADADALEVKTIPSPPSDGGAAPAGMAFLPGQIYIPTAPPEAFAPCQGFEADVTLPMPSEVYAVGLRPEAARVLYLEAGRWLVAHSRVDSSRRQVIGQTPVGVPAALGVQALGPLAGGRGIDGSWLWLLAVVALTAVVGVSMASRRA